MPAAMIDDLTKQLQAKKAQIAESRLLSWSSASDAEPVKGVKLLPLTARAWVDLRLAENAFFTVKEYDLLDVIGYYWRNSFEYSAYADDKKQKQLARTIAESDLRGPSTAS